MAREEIKIPQNYKTEVKEEVKQQPQTFVVKTEMDAYINEVMQTQPKTLDDIKVVDTTDSPTNRISLPKDVSDALISKGLTPRWINKDKKMIDRAIHIRGWLIVNKMYFPEIKKYHFTANGTIENGDSILGFMPSERADKLRRRPGEISQERIKTLPIDKYKNDQGEKIGYYKPALTSEKDGEMETVGIKPDKP